MSLTVQPNLVKIIIPIYSDSLTEDESISVKQCLKVLSGYPISFVKPESLELKNISKEYPAIGIENFDDNYFKSVESYNRLMLSAHFYERFLDFEYILIYQLDAYAFRDELKEWCAKGFNYIGAPWIPRGLFWKRIRDYFQQLRGNNKRKISRTLYYRVGNGGFSLRKVSSFYDITSNEKELIRSYLHPEDKSNKFIPEDVFWALEPQRRGYNFPIPDYREALLFSFDKYPQECLQISQTIPFGCHAWNRKKAFPFWKNYIK